jgi:hypothetical protein
MTKIKYIYIHIFLDDMYCHITTANTPDVDGMIILRWIFKKWEGVVGTGWSGLRIGTGGGHLWVR